MPRIRQYAQKYACEDFLREIRKQQGYYNLTTQQELADAAGMSQPTVSNRMKDPSKLTFGEFRGWVKAIKPDPRVVLAFLGYTSKDIKAALGTEAAQI